MASTNAERQRRYRAHNRGDHSLCNSRRCDGASVTVTPVTTSPSTPAVTPPAGLGARGRRLWRDLATPTTPPAQRVLMEEACRIADRLERLDMILRGESDTWLRLSLDEDLNQAVVIIDKAMSEARQQAVVLKQIVAEIRQSACAAGKPTGEQGGSLRDQLAARRAARLASAAGS